jgi:signal transduction histidine kinase
MTPMLMDMSAVACVAGGLIVGGAGARLPRRRLLPLAAALGVQAAYAVIAASYVRLPFSSIRVHGLLSVLCLMPAVWLAAALALCEGGMAAPRQRWRGGLTTQAIAASGAAVLMHTSGIDWVTGIGPDPAVVLTRWGLTAMVIGALPGCLAVAVVVEGLRRGRSATPALHLGIAGAAVGPLWVASAALWCGYLTAGPVVAATMLGAVAALVLAVGAVRETPARTSLAPSRRLVYGATALALAGFYLLTARAALTWIAELARDAMPSVLPAFAFATVTGLVVTGASRRWRYRLWVFIGRHVFQSKHDYGEVWIRLTNLVSAAHSVPALVTGAVWLCRNVLGDRDVTVWLSDPGGRLWRAATTAPDPVCDVPNEPVEPPDHDHVAPQEPAEEAALERLTGSTFACALHLNGRLLGVFAVEATDSGLLLDEEDRRLVRYVAAQLASALGLLRLGEEVADSREVGSFNRLSAFVVHDLKNLVAQQSLVLENAAKFQRDPAFILDALAAFADSTTRMRALIARLRSRDCSGASNLDRCDLLAVLRDLTAAPRVARHPGPRIDLQVPRAVRQCPARLNPSVAAQLFSNLLVNAVESLPAEAGEITVSIAPAVGGWQVAVRDNGSGIPAAFLRDHAFRPFHTTKGNGIGIGLYQCKSIVDAAGGTIFISSKPGVGTVVHVTLPAAGVIADGDPARRGDVA